MPTRKRRKSRKRELEHVTYIFKIENWRPDYAVWANLTAKMFPAPYTESATIEITAKCISPESLKHRRVTLCFNGDRIQSNCLNEEIDREARPQGVGFLNIQRPGRESTLYIPNDSLPFSQSSLMAGKFRYVMLSGTPLRYRSANIDIISFAQHIDRDNIPCK